MSKPVWMGMHQTNLDTAYDQTKYALNMKEVLDRFATNSAALRARIGEPLHFKYGKAPVESLDFFAARHPRGPTLLFIHGGAWRAGYAKNYAFLAEPFLHAGVNVLIAEFAHVQDSELGLETMTDQICRAIVWTYQDGEGIGIDPNQLYLAGHSSGAHLAACAATTDWPAKYGVSANIIRGVFCCSGLFDLKPVRLSSRNQYLKLTDDIEHNCSPERHLQRLNAPLILAYGTLESPEFIRQSQSFAASATAAGKAIKLILLDGYNHFEILETLTAQNSALVTAILEQMQIAD
jgi:arylformamidase